MSENKPKVSIICLAYNHINYIKDALDSFLMQKTDFPFEILINDDASKDGTAEIIKEYQAKYPDIIRATLQTQNQLKKGNPPKYYIYPLIKGEYVALNDGDDYWTDEYKLQKQVDFLDKNPDYSICFHPVEIKYSNGEKSTFYPDDNLTHGKNDFELLDILQKNIIQTNSVMYRWIYNRTDYKVEEQFPDNVMPGDWFMSIMHSQKGKVHMLNDVMSVYRKNSGSIYSAKWNDILARFGTAHLNFFVELEKRVPEYLKYGGHKHTLQFAAQVFQVFLDKGYFKSMKKVLDLCPDLLEIQQE